MYPSPIGTRCKAQPVRPWPGQTAIAVPRLCLRAMPAPMGAAAGTPSSTPTPTASPFGMALSLALLLGIQAVATDLYLPALPMLARDLAAAMPAVQLTMSAFVLAFGVAQLLWGPVADH